VSDVLAYKVNAAIDVCKTRNIGIDAFVISGGVAANKFIRNALEHVCNIHGIKFSAPPINLCTDNAAMIAWNGIEKFNLRMSDALNFTPRPRWPMGLTPLLF
jgi:N6-L-threonylcarbamoyladenine synthase